MKIFMQLRTERHSSGLQATVMIVPEEQQEHAKCVHV